MHVLKRWSALVVFVVVSCVSCASDGGIVQGLKVVNETVYDLEVRVTDADRGGWVPLGRTRSGETTTHQQVDDVGDVWIFSFEYPGRMDGGELRVSRDVLEDDDWEVRVPDDVEDRLRSAGVEPSDER
jgi:hypothetical protein